MNAELVSGAVAGALGGLNTEYQSHDKEQQLMKQAEIRGQIQQMIAQLNDEGRTKRNAATNDTRETVATTAADSRQNVASTAAASRETVADKNNETRSNIAGDRLNFSFANMNSRDQRMRDIADQAEQGRNDRWKTPSGNTNLLETGRNKRWATPSGNAQLGADVTQRGQDMSQATATRGQDNSFALGTDRNAIARKRGAVLDSIFQVNPPGGGSPDDPQQQPDAAAPQVAPVRAPIPVTPRVGPGGGGAATLAPSVTSTQMVHPSNGGPDYPAGGRPPVSAKPPVKPPNPALAAATLKGAALLASFNNEKDPQKKAALAQQLRAVQAEIKAARGQQ